MGQDHLENTYRAEFKKIRIYQPEDLLEIEGVLSGQEDSLILYLALDHCDGEYILKEKGSTTGIGFRAKEASTEITYLGVHSKIQGKGIGRELVSSVERICKKLGIRKIWSRNN